MFVQVIIGAMSEYIEIQAELDEDGQTVVFQTNLSLSTGVTAERYESVDALAEGSPVAQALMGIEGIAAAEIDGDLLLITLAPAADWHAIAADVSAALKDFFL
jgi:hypothetical protein